MRARNKIVLGMLAAAAVAAAGVGFMQFRPLRVVPLQPERDVVIKVFGLGTVEARILSKVGFKTSGTLSELQVDHGDRVTEGQILARIGNSEQSAKLDKAKAQIVVAKAAVDVATAAANKSEALLAQRTQTNRRRQELLIRQAVSVEAAEEAMLNEKIAQADAQVTKTEIETAQGKLDDALAQFEYEKVLLRQHELRAPFDAIVVQRNKELGSVLAAGEALFTLVAPESVWVLAYVDESRAGNVRVGQTAEIKLRSLPQRVFTGRVARIGIESDRVNEERRVYVTCETCPSSFFLGEQAEVLTTTAKIEQALMVPEILIEKFDGTTGIVWTVENGRLQRRTATFGNRSLDGRAEVLAGIAQDAAIPAAIEPGFREGRLATLAGQKP
jgi:HlyD family secretion protein